MFDVICKIFCTPLPANENPGDLVKFALCITRYCESPHLR